MAGRLPDLRSWERHAPPADKTRQWKDYRSAKELAQAWCRSTPIRLPAEISELFRPRMPVADFTMEQAVAEMDIKFDNLGKRRQSDLVMWGEGKAKGKRRRVIITVEAKADESYAGTIGRELVKTPKKSHKPERIRQLVRGILGRQVDASIEELPYQLFHALAATTKLAKAKEAEVGVLVIHEFVSLATDFDKFAANTKA